MKARAVVHRTGDEAVVDELQRLAHQHGDVTDAHQGARLLAVLGADVDVQLAQLGHLLAVLLAQQVDRFAPTTPGSGPPLRDQLGALADEDLGVPAADAGEPQEALIVDVRDDQADLIDVADDREERGAGRRARDAGNRRAHDVDRHIVGERAGGLREDGCRSRLVARRAGGREQLAEHFGQRHARQPMTLHLAVRRGRRRRRAATPGRAPLDGRAAATGVLDTVAR